MQQVKGIITLLSFDHLPALLPPLTSSPRLCSSPRLDSSWTGTGGGVAHAASQPETRASSRRRMQRGPRLKVAATEAWAWPRREQHPAPLPAAPAVVAGSISISISISISSTSPSPSPPRIGGGGGEIPIARRPSPALASITLALRALQHAPATFNHRTGKKALILTLPHTRTPRLWS